MVNQIKKILFLSFFVSFFSWSNTCDKGVCVEFLNRMLPIPNHYSLNVESIKESNEVKFHRIKYQGKILYVESEIALISKLECGEFCEPIEKVQDFAIREKFFSNNQLSSALWRVNSSAGKPSFIGVLYSQNVVLMIIDNPSLWESWSQKMLQSQ